MREPFYEIVRSKDGPRVSVELDNSLEVGFSFVIMGMATLAAIASALGLIGGRHIVRVGVSRGARLDVSSHGYKRRDTALAVADLLVEELKTIGSSVLDDWNRDPTHWLDRINALSG